MLTRSPELFTAPQGDALREVRSEQIGAFMSRSVHRLYDVTREEFRRFIPDFLPQPDTYRERFYRPLIVVPLPIRDLLRLANIPTSYWGEEIGEVDKVREIVFVPRKPYTIWTHDGERHFGRTPQLSESLLQGDEVASPLVEVIALYIQYPEIFNRRTIIAAGTRQDNTGIMGRFLDPEKKYKMLGIGVHRDDKCSLGVYYNNYSHDRAGILSRGEQINVAA